MENHDEGKRNVNTFLNITLKSFKYQFLSQKCIHKIHKAQTTSFLAPVAQILKHAGHSLLPLKKFPSM